MTGYISLYCGTHVTSTSMLVLLYSDFVRLRHTVLQYLSAYNDIRIWRERERPGKIMSIVGRWCFIVLYSVVIIIYGPTMNSVLQMHFCCSVRLEIVYTFWGAHTVMLTVYEAKPLLSRLDYMYYVVYPSINSYYVAIFGVSQLCHVPFCIKTKNCYTVIMV